MIRIPTRRLVVAGTLAASLFALSTASAEEALLELPPLTLAQVEAFDVVDQLPGQTLLDVESGPATDGCAVMILVDGAPSAALILAPGSNFVTVPSTPSSVFVVVGDLVEARVAGYGSEDDPGSW